MPFYETETFLKEILETENARRLSSTVQELYQAAEETETEDWLVVTDQLQRKILIEAGVCGADMEAALMALRQSTYTYPNLASIPIYRNFQRARQGDLVEGCDAPDVNMLTNEGQQVSLIRSVQSNNRPALICAGSIS